MNSEELVAHARARFDHEINRKNLKEKYKAKLLFAYNGGMFCAGPELQTTLMTCPDSEAVILDLYDNPVKVDTKKMFAMSQQRWQEQMNAWLVEYNELNKNR